MKPAATVSFEKAMMAMHRPGARLLQMHNPYGGSVYYVIPLGMVDEKTAEKIKKHPLVRGAKDGLFPGIDQTWQMEKAYG